MSRPRLPFCWALALVCLIGALPAVAQQPTLDELLDLQPEQPAEQPTDNAEPTDAPDTPADAPAGEAVPIEESVQRMLTGEEAADAFEAAVKEMDEVSLRLGRELDPGLRTQRLQEAILAKLDQVIAAARQQQQSASSGSSGGGGGQQQPGSRSQDSGGSQVARPNQPGQAQGQRGQTSPTPTGGEHAGDFSPGQADRVEPGQGPLEELRREWGSLPPRLREEIAEGLEERFSPVYRSLTEQYYRRLAEEQP